MISTFGCASRSRSLCAGVAAMGSSLLRRRDACGLHGGGEGFGVFAEYGFGLFFGEPALDDAKLAEPLGHLGRFGERADFGPESVDDGIRRALGRRKAVPGGKLEARNRLSNGGNIRRRRYALRGPDRDQP